jgi:hypothetical protein
MPDVCDDRTRGDSWLTIAKVGLFYALQVQMGSCRSFPFVGPTQQTYTPEECSLLDQLTHLLPMSCSISVPALRP